MLELNHVGADLEHVQLNFTCCLYDAAIVTGKMRLNAAAVDLVYEK